MLAICLSGCGPDRKLHATSTLLHLGSPSFFVFPSAERTGKKAATE